jgi:hypothetical protein
LDKSTNNRNFAFDTYYPAVNEIRLAEQRGQRYWQNNSQRFPNSTRSLAVYTPRELALGVVERCSETAAQHVSSDISKIMEFYEQCGNDSSNMLDR